MADVLEFAEPIWLSVAVAVGMAGVWALWRSRRRGRAVSSLKLWREVGVAQGEVRRRQMDPLWVMVWVAGVLAGVALGGPKWVLGTRGQVAAQWAVRSVGDYAEVWVCVPAGAEGMELVVNGAGRKVAGEELRNGVAVAVRGERVKMELRGREGVAVAEFVRPAGAGREFGLIKVTDAGMQVDAALERAFLVQGQAREGDPSVRPEVMLVNAAQVAEEELADAALVVAQPATALPGVTLGKRIETDGEGWKPEIPGVEGAGIKWPGFVSVSGVRVKALREVQLSGDWRVLARVDGKPWVAVREVRWPGGEKGVWVWLGSEPGAETNWPKEAGFVVFFADLARQSLGDAGGLVVWHEVAGEKARAVREVGLAGWLGGVGIGLLVGGGGWFVGRGGGQ